MTGSQKNVEIDENVRALQGWKKIRLELKVDFC